MATIVINNLASSTETVCYSLLLLSGEIRPSPVTEGVVTIINSAKRQTGYSRSIGDLRANQRTNSGDVFGGGAGSNSRSSASAEGMSGTTDGVSEAGKFLSLQVKLDSHCASGCGCIPKVIARQNFKEENSQLEANCVRLDLVENLQDTALCNGELASISSSPQKFGQVESRSSDLSNGNETLPALEEMGQINTAHLKEPFLKASPLKPDQSRLNNTSTVGVLQNQQANGIKLGPASDVAIDKPTNESGSVCRVHATSWPVLQGRFKALVDLAPGLNPITVNHPNSAPIQLFVTFVSPPRHAPFVRPVYIRCADDPEGRFQGPADPAETGVKQEGGRRGQGSSKEGQGSGGEGQGSGGEDCSQESALRRIGLAARLLQTFTAEKLLEHFGERKTFQLECDVDAAQPECHVFTSRLTLAQAREMSGNDLWMSFARELMSSRQFAPASRARCKWFAFMSFTVYVPPPGVLPQTHSDVLRFTRGHTALGGGGLALYGTGTLHCWAQAVDELTARLTDQRKIDRSKLMDDSAYREFYWANYSTGLGAALHELGHTFELAHSPTGIMARGFDDIHRVFSVQPGRGGGHGSAGGSPVPPYSPRQSPIRQSHQANAHPRRSHASPSPRRPSHSLPLTPGSFPSAPTPPGVNTNPPGVSPGPSGFGSALPGVSLVQVETSFRRLLAPASTHTMIVRNYDGSELTRTVTRHRDGVETIAEVTTYRGAAGSAAAGAAVLGDKMLFREFVKNPTTGKSRTTISMHSFKLPPPPPEPKTSPSPILRTPALADMKASLPPLVRDEEMMPPLLSTRVKTPPSLRSEKDEMLLHLLTCDETLPPLQKYDDTPPPLPRRGEIPSLPSSKPAPPLPDAEIEFASQKISKSTATVKFSSLADEAKVAETCSCDNVVTKARIISSGSAVDHAASTELNAAGLCRVACAISEQSGIELNRANPVASGTESRSQCSHARDSIGSLSSLDVEILLSADSLCSALLYGECLAEEAASSIAPRQPVLDSYASGAVNKTSSSCSHNSTGTCFRSESVGIVSDFGISSGNFCSIQAGDTLRALQSNNASQNAGISARSLLQGDSTADDAGMSARSPLQDAISQDAILQDAITASLKECGGSMHEGHVIRSSDLNDASDDESHSLQASLGCDSPRLTTISIGHEALGRITVQNPQAAIESQFLTMNLIGQEVFESKELALDVTMNPIGGVAVNSQDPATDLIGQQAVYPYVPITDDTDEELMNVHELERSAIILDQSNCSKKLGIDVIGGEEICIDTIRPIEACQDEKQIKIDVTSLKQFCFDGADQSQTIRLDIDCKQASIYETGPSDEMLESKGARGDEPPFPSTPPRDSEPPAAPVEGEELQSLTPVSDAVRFQDTRYKDGGAHWYRASAVLLHYHKWFNVERDVVTPPESLPTLVGRVIRCPLGVRLVELRTHPDTAVCHHWEFLHPSPPTLFPLDPAELAQMTPSGVIEVQILVEDDQGNVLKRRVTLSELRSPMGCPTEP